MNLVSDLVSRIFFCQIFLAPCKQPFLAKAQDADQAIILRADSIQSTQMAIRFHYIPTMRTELSLAGRAKRHDVRQGGVFIERE